MRIVFVAWRDLASPEAGGSEVYVDRIASGAVARGHDIALACAGPHGPRVYEMVNTGGRYSQYLRAPLKVRRHCRDADVLVEVLNGMPYFSPLWWRGPRIVLVHHVHRELWEQFFPRPVAALGWGLEWTGLRVAHRNSLFVTVSDSSAASLTDLGVRRERLRIVENGVDIAPPNGPRASEPQFLALGRLVAYKRLHLLLDMWEKVHPVIGGRLVIAGQGYEGAGLEARNVPGVELVGFVDDGEKRRLLSESWMLVHAASVEGWGLVLMEAAAHSTPSLAFNVPGVRDAVVNGESGMLADTPDEFVKQWIRLAGNQARRDELGKAARERAAEFAWDRSVDKFLDVMEEARRERPAGR